MVVEIVEQLIKEDGYVFITIKSTFVESVIKCKSLALFVIITTELLNNGVNFTITSKNCMKQRLNKIYGKRKCEKIC